jgi:hypothetical protein
MIKNTGIVFISTLSMMAVSPIGWAVENPGRGVGTESPSTVALRSWHIYGSDSGATAGKISITETEFDYAYKFKAFGELPVEMSVGVTHIDVDEDDPVEISSRLESRRLGLSTKFPAPFIEDDRFFMGLDVLPTLNTDDWEWEPRAFRMPFRSYLIFKESEDFILVAGISVRPGYDNEVMPVVGLIYRPNDRLSFNLAQDHPHIAYRLDEATKFVWEFDYALEEYEVTRGAQKGVVLKYREVSSGFGLQRRFGDNLEGALSVGAVFNRRLEYKDGAGKIAPDTALYAGIHCLGRYPAS